MNWINFLQCPVCHAKCKKLSNYFICTICKKQFAIKHGIPIFVDLKNLPSHLAGQVTYFEQEDVKRGEYGLELWQERYVSEFLRYSDLKKPSLIIDNATGSGYMAIELAKKGYQIIATDLTLMELVKLKRIIKRLGLTKQIYLLCCSSECLPLKNNIADGMVANAILEHLPREKTAIKEMSRILKKKAILMLAMPLTFHYLFPLFWPINWLHDHRIGHLRRYTRDIILKRFSVFREIRTYYTGHIAKVLITLIYILTKQKRLLPMAEYTDEVFSDIPLWASNVVTILRRV